MFSCTNYETMKIKAGESVGCTRRYPSGCPHEIGSQLPLCEEKKGGAEPFAVARLISIRPSTVGQRRRSGDPEAKRLAVLDGFPNQDAWYQHFRMMYGKAGIQDDTQVFRLQFKIDQMEK